MKVIITGKFVEDWQPASEDLYAGAEQGTEDNGFINLIDKIDNAPKTKHGKFGFNVVVDLTEHEMDLLKGEAKYRMEYWSLLYQDTKADIDKPAHNAAKKLYLFLEGTK
jgi:hypothetical protein